MSLTRHASRIIEWKKQELQLLDRKKRKVLTMCGASHPKADVDKLHIRRSRENHRLISVEVYVVLEMSSLNNYLISAEEKFLRKNVKNKNEEKELKKKKVFIRMIKVIMKAKERNEIRGCNIGMVK